MDIYAEATNYEKIAYSSGNVVTSNFVSKPDYEIYGRLLYRSFVITNCVRIGFLE